jgi:hypothetical protein
MTSATGEITTGRGSEMHATLHFHRGPMLALLAVFFLAADAGAGAVRA